MVQCHIHTTGPSLPGHLLFPVAHYSSINRCHRLCWLLHLCKDSFSLQHGDVACWARLRTLQRGNHITGMTEQHPQPLGSTGDIIPSNWGTDPTYPVSAPQCDKGLTALSTPSAFAFCSCSM